MNMGSYLGLESAINIAVERYKSIEVNLCFTHLNSPLKNTQRTLQSNSNSASSKPSNVFYFPELTRKPKGDRPQWRRRKRLSMYNRARSKIPNQLNPTVGCDSGGLSDDQIPQHSRSSRQARKQLDSSQQTTKISTAVAAALSMNEPGSKKRVFCCQSKLEGGGSSQFGAPQGWR
jgi:hypothetical protein